MTKILTVATEIQKKIFEDILYPEIHSGFWKNARPADHADLWEGITVVIGTNLGLNFDPPRKYNFVNPDFFHKEETNLLKLAQGIDPEITIRQLKKQLIALNQIVDGRLKEIGGEVLKLTRGRKLNSSEETIVEGSTTVRRVPANIVEDEEDTEAA